MFSRPKTMATNIIKFRNTGTLPLISEIFLKKYQFFYCFPKLNLSGAWMIQVTMTRIMLLGYLLICPSPTPLLIGPPQKFVFKRTEIFFYLTEKFRQVVFEGFSYVLHVLGHFWMFAVKITEWLFSLKSLGLWTPTYPKFGTKS